MTLLQEFDWNALFSPEMFATVLRVLLYAAVGFVALRIIVIVIRRVDEDDGECHSAPDGCRDCRGDGRQWGEAEQDDRLVGWL